MQTTHLTSPMELLENRQRQEVAARTDALLREATTDRVLRRALLDDPHTALERRGITVPEGSTIACIEADGPVLILPDFLNEIQELDTEELLGVNGGDGSPSLAALTPLSATSTPMCVGASISAATVILTYIITHDH
ncbi:MAG: hypothetical protein MUE41_00655 [Gemmatimonadaceae bacterium]|jgi:hypothetical protein|nr:hypothetical protein [Gemmatimonadaceae bacterium]